MKYQAYIDNGHSHDSAIAAMISDIRRNFMLYPSTVTTCATEGCNTFAKGGYCAECLAFDLAKVTKKPRAASEFLVRTEQAHKAACELIGIEQ